MTARAAASQPELWLTPEEVQRLTGGKKYRPAQRRALERRQIRYIPADDGTPLVLRAVVEKKGGLGAAAPEPGPAPDFSIFPKVS